MHRYGVESRNGVYASSGLAALFDRGVRIVEVRSLANDHDRVEIIHDGSWQCSAMRVGGPTEKEVARTGTHH